MSDKPTPESVREILIVKWPDKLTANRVKHEQANRVLRWLYDEWQKNCALNDEGKILSARVGLANTFNHAILCADELYRKDER